MDDSFLWKHNIAGKALLGREQTPRTTAVVLAVEFRD